MNLGKIGLFFSKAASRRAVSAGVGIVLAGLLLGVATAGAQENRLHQIDWTHQGGGVSRFIVLISPLEGSLAEARQVDVGLPDGVLIGSTNLYSAMVSFAADEHLSVAAVGLNGTMSVPSEWKGMPPTRPGQPLLVEP
ncbi:MAG: hypothetical protein GY910_21790 [bacterium]|nr:hypothetical protein [bacterium]